ncbi:SPOR domain-containing protein [Psychromonas sp.]|uniref:SPOR domain-containing protein n=1 Tax=Psychromonas sp. TaxID=1884585 RepID=UPI0035657A3E
MSANSQYNMRPSWIKDNLSQILLLFAMLIVVVSLVIYFFSGPLSNFIFADDGATKQISAIQQPAKMITENWQEDPDDAIEDTQFSVGESDLNGKRVVIARQELIGLEERYVVNVVEQVTTPSAQQPEVPTQQNNNAQQSISMIKMNEPGESEIGLPDGEEQKPAGQQAEASLPVEAAEESNLLDLILTPVDLLLAKPAHLFTVKLSELETQEKLLAFIGQNELPEENVYIYTIKRNKQSWFVVIFGNYESFAAAKTAQQGLSASLSNMLTSIIIYQEVHQDLQYNND